MIVFYFQTSETWKSDRPKFMLGFDMRSATKFIEKTLIRRINAFQLTLDRLAWQTLPMTVRRLFQLRKVSRHSMIIRIR